MNMFNYMNAFINSFYFKKFCLACQKGYSYTIPPANKTSCTVFAEEANYFCPSSETCL